MNIITIKIMPRSINSDLKKIQQQAIEQIKKYSGKPGKIEIEKIAFGLKALKIYFTINNKPLDPIENSIKNLKQVKSAQIIDIRKSL